MDVVGARDGDAGRPGSVPVDDAALVRIVGASLGRSVSAVAEVSTEPLAGMGFIGSIHRLSGIARDGEAQVPWSIIRKHVADTGGNEADLRYWRREPLTYSSGLLDDLTGVRAPRCHAVVERDDGVELWLEDVPSDAGPWDFARTEIAARDLGRFNASYLTERAVPGDVWLSRNWLFQWVEQAADAFAELDAAIEDPWIARLWPRPVADQARALWTARHRLYRVLAELPPVLAHIDAIQANAFVDAGRTTLIDWAFVGHASLGEDLVPLVGGSTVFGEMHPDDLPDLDGAGFSSYVTGLRDVGWRGDVRDVRFAYCAASALRLCVGPIAFHVCGVGPNGGVAHNGGLRDAEQRATWETMFRRGIDDILDTVAATNRFLVALGAEALAFLDDR